MIVFFFYYFLPPFLLTFIIPGLLCFFTFKRDKDIDLLAFILYIVTFGFAYQLLIGISLVLVQEVSLSSVWKVILISIVLMSIHIVIARICGSLARPFPKITIGRFDITVILIACLLVLLILLQFQKDTYFNIATDQYYWFAYTERFLINPREILSIFFHNIINLRTILSIQGFPVFLSPLLAFVPKEIDIYQNFILVETVFFYILWMFAIARVAFAMLPVRSIGLLAPVILFLPYWANYYVMSAGVVPQNIGIFLFIVGMFFFYSSHWESVRKHNYFVIFFLVFLYAMHVGTWFIFVLSIGLVEIICLGVRFLRKKWRSIVEGFLRIGESEQSRLIVAITLPIVFIVIIRYIFFFFNIFPSVDPTTTSYYKDIDEALLFVNQPYLGSYLEYTMKFAIIAVPIAILYFLYLPKGKLFGVVTISFLLSIFFLHTPFLSYNAVLMSWQPFRYFLFLYPGMTLLALFLGGVLMSLLYRVLPWRLSRMIAGFILLMVLFPFLLNVHDQHKYVEKDMFNGSSVSSYMYIQNRINTLRELQAIASKFSGNTMSVVYVSGNIDRAHAEWAFAPHQLFIVQPDCNQKVCFTYDQFTKKRIPFQESLENTSVVVLDKSTPLSYFVESLIKESFLLETEQNEFFVYKRI